MLPLSFVNALCRSAGVIALAVSAGWSGGRSPECDPEGQSNVWERAKAPELDSYCADLAQGAALLTTAPNGTAAHAAQLNAAIRKADDAEASLAGHAAARVLHGRALIELGRAQDGVTLLDEAAALDARAFDDPSALLSLARGQARLGQMDKAKASYALLLPRASALPLAQRGPAYFEAGLLSALAGKDANDEATDRFREAIHGGQDAVRSVAVAALALALDRAGRGDEAAALFADRGVPATEAFQDPRVKDSVATAGAPLEAEAMQAMAYEAAHDAARARAAWRDYADKAPSGPWRDEAAAHAQVQPRATPAAKARTTR